MILLAREVEAGDRFRLVESDDLRWHVASQIKDLGLHVAILHSDEAAPHDDQTRLFLDGSSYIEVDREEESG